MSNAKNNFYTTIALMRSLQSDPSFIDQGLAPSEHNIKARILRNGLVVSAFTLLETYLEDRLGEAILRLTTSNIPYSGFSDELRSFFSVRAVQGLSNRLSFMDKNDKLLFAEQNISSIARIFSTPSSYSNFGFRSTGSNIKPEDITDLPRFFGVTNGWSQLQAVCSEIGASRYDLNNDFRNFKKARNLGAHEIGSNMASSDLNTHIETALLIGIVADISFTNAIDWLCKSPTHARAVQSISTNRPVYRFLQERSNNKWAEYSMGSNRAVKLYPDLQTARNAILSRPNRTDVHIVAKDLTLRPVFLI